MSEGYDQYRIFMGDGENKARHCPPKAINNSQGEAQAREFGYVGVPGEFTVKVPDKNHPMGWNYDSTQGYSIVGYSVTSSGVEIIEETSTKLDLDNPQEFDGSIEYPDKYIDFTFDDSAMVNECLFDYHTLSIDGNGDQELSITFLQPMFISWYYFGGANVKFDKTFTGKEYGGQSYVDKDDTLTITATTGPSIEDDDYRISVTLESSIPTKTTTTTTIEETDAKGSVSVTGSIYNNNFRYATFPTGEASNDRDTYTITIYTAVPIHLYLTGQIKLTGDSTFRVRTSSNARKDDVYWDRSDTMQNYLPVPTLFAHAYNLAAGQTITIEYYSFQDGQDSLEDFVMRIDELQYPLSKETRTSASKSLVAAYVGDSNGKAQPVIRRTKLSCIENYVEQFFDVNISDKRYASDGSEIITSTRVYPEFSWMTWEGWSCASDSTFPPALVFTLPKKVSSQEKLEFTMTLTAKHSLDNSKLFVFAYQTEDLVLSNENLQITWSKPSEGTTSLDTEGSQTITVGYINNNRWNTIFSDYSLKEGSTLTFEYTCPKGTPSNTFIVYFSTPTTLDF